MTFPTFTAALDLKSNMFDLAHTLFDDDADPSVQVSYGAMGSADPGSDQVVFLDVNGNQEPATMGTGRSRDETLTLDVGFSCFRAGVDDDREPTEGAYALLSRLEDHLRTTDPTVGGAVLWCFLTEHQSVGRTVTGNLGAGRLIYVLARFTARARISNH